MRQQCVPSQKNGLIRAHEQCPARFTSRPAAAKARESGNAAVARAATARAAADVAPLIAQLQANGAESLRAIAAGLNGRGIPTARGTGRWSAVQVACVLGR